MPMSWTGSTRPPEDPYKTNLTLTNLEAVWANLRASGAPRLVLTMVAVSLDEELAHLRAAIPEARGGTVRLRVSEGDLLWRVRGREAGWGYGRQAPRTIEQARRMALAPPGDRLLVETSGWSVVEVAREVLARAGWAPS
jgi:hypothetical protein